jgi:hypothetical protein
MKQYMLRNLVIGASWREEWAYVVKEARNPESEGVRKKTTPTMYWNSKKNLNIW